MKKMKAAIIGHPVSHSKSPIIHQYWMDKYGVPGVFEKIDIACDELAKKFADIKQGGYDGLSVTLPHKEAVMNLCDSFDYVVGHIGAVNMIRMDNGKAYGFNTDVFGFVENIKQTCPDFDFKFKKAVVLGAGGAARAVTYGLLRESVAEVLIVNRTPDKGKKIAEDMCGIGKVSVQDWHNRAGSLKNADILINTTPLGMSGFSVLDIDLSHLPQHAIVSDIIYAPLVTDLLQRAQARGNPIVTGIGMLLHQARPAFEAWTGILPDVDDALIKRVLER